MSKISAMLFLSSVASFYGVYQSAISNVMLGAATIGGEQLLENLAFRCPKDRTTWDMGMMFLCCPPVIIFLINLTMDRKIWKKCRGCLRRNAPREERPGLPAAVIERMNQPLPNCRTKFLFFATSLYRILIIPSMWVVTALMDGDYLTCSRAETPEDFEEALIFSHVTAWAILMIAVILGTLVPILFRLCDVRTDLEDLHQTALEEKTDQKIIEMVIEEAGEKAKSLFPNPEKGKEMGTQTEEAAVVRSEGMSVEVNDRNAMEVPKPSGVDNHSKDITVDGNEEIPESPELRNDVAVKVDEMHEIKMDFSESSEAVAYSPSCPNEIMLIHKDQELTEGSFNSLRL